MGPMKATVCLVTLAGFICLTNASGSQAQNHESGSTLRTTRTFGVKTVSKQTGNSNDGIVTTVARQTVIRSGNINPLPKNTQPVFRDQRLALNVNQQVSNDDPQFIDHSYGQDDTVYGLLPAENLPQKPVNFGTRIQSKNDPSNCGDKGECSSLPTSVGEDGGFNSDIRRGHQPESVEGTNIQNEEHNSQSNAEQREIVDNVHQQEEINQFPDDENQRTLEEFSNEFVNNDQYDNAFHSFRSEEAFNDNPQNPVLDPGFPDQGDSQSNFQPGNVAPFQDNQGSQVRQDDVEERQSPVFFDYADQQSYDDSASIVQTLDAYNPVGQQDIPFGRDIGLEDSQNQNNQFDQEAYQQQFIVPQRVVTNENSNDFQDEGQHLFLSEEERIDALRYSVPGSPGEDYPIFYQVPETSFDCNQQQFTAGIYGDVDSQCQVFHFCKESGGRDSFLCPNGTVFNQQYFVCDWWYNYNCADTPSFYNLNAQLYWDFDSLSPSQILSGSGIDSQEEAIDQVDNIGEFPISAAVNSQVPAVRNQEVHNIASHQQSFDSNVKFETSGRHPSDNFAEKRKDITVIRDKSSSTSTSQSNFAQRTRISIQGANSVAPNLNINPTKRPDPIPNNPSLSRNSQSTISGTAGINFNSNVNDFTQTHIDSLDFEQQVLDERAPAQTNFGQTQLSHSDGDLDSRTFPTHSTNRINQGSENIAKDNTLSISSENDSPKNFQVNTRHQQFQTSIHSTSSDTNRNSQQSDSDIPTQFLDQDGFVEQQVHNEHHFQSNQKTLDEGTGNISPVFSNQDTLEEFPTGFENVGFSQDLQTKFPSEVSGDQFHDSNQNVPQPDNYQQTIEFPLEERSEAAERAVDGLPELSPTKGFDAQNQVNVQQQNLDVPLDDIFFNRQTVFPSNAPVEKGITSEQNLFHNSDSQVTDNPLQRPQTEVASKDFNENVQSVRNEDNIPVNQENIDNSQNVKNNFAQEDLTNINQEAVNYDEILDGFRNRNVAFKDTSSGFQSSDKTINRNRPTSPRPENGIQQQIHENTGSTPKPIEHVSFPKNQNTNTNKETFGQNAIPQQNIEINNIYSMMRGFPNNSPQEQDRNGQSLNQQRLSFRPYGQNTAPLLNSNFQEQRQNPNSQVRPVTQNLQISQNDQPIVFANEHQQRNDEQRWWQNTQQSKEFASRDFSNQQGRNFNEQNHRQSHQNAQARFSHRQLNGPSNINLNVPTNAHQFQTSAFAQNSRTNPNQNRVEFQSVQQNEQQVFHRFNNVQKTRTISDNSQIQNAAQLNSGGPSSEGVQLNHGVKGQFNPDQSQFQNRAPFNSGNFQPQQNRNQQPLQNFKPLQNSRNNVEIQNVEQVNVRSIFARGNPGVKGHYSPDQSQFRNAATLNLGNIPEQSIQQIEHQNRQEHIQNINSVQHAPSNQQQIHNDHSQNQNTLQINSRDISIGGPQGNIRLPEGNVGGPRDNNHGRPQDNVREPQGNIGGPQGNFGGPQNNIKVPQRNIVRSQDNSDVNGHFDADQSQFQNRAPFNNGNTPNESFQQNSDEIVFRGSENSRQGRSNNFHSPQPNGQIQPQKINANDAIVYSQNEPPVAESSISYNGWRPIVKY